jgi:antitoxin FitA
MVYLMTTITLKSVPPALHRKLKTMAKAHGRSLNREILTTLETTLHGTRLDAEELGSHARAVRESLGVYLTQKDLAEMKNAGRR